MSVRIKYISSATVTYEVDNSSRAGLVGSLLAEVEETLSSVRRPGGVVVRNVWLLTTEVGGKVLGFDRFRTEPEKLLLENEAPR
jgi:hypothetical protein